MPDAIASPPPEPAALPPRRGVAWLDWLVILGVVAFEMTSPYLRPEDDEPTAKERDADLIVESQGLPWVGLPPRPRAGWRPQPRRPRSGVTPRSSDGTGGHPVHRRTSLDRGTRPGGAHPPRRPAVDGHGPRPLPGGRRLWRDLRRSLRR